MGEAVPMKSHEDVNVEDGHTEEDDLIPYLHILCMSTAPRLGILVNSTAEASGKWEIVMPQIPRSFTD